MVDSLYDYKAFLSDAGNAPIGTLPPAAATSARVAVIGAGLSGMCAAYELLRVGIQPVIFEANDRIGGRMWTEKFKADDETVAPAFAELGAMRFSPMMKAFDYYAKKFSITYADDFPNPLKVPTLLAFPGFKQFVLPADAAGEQDLDARFKKMDKEWGAARGALLTDILAAREAGDIDRTRALWQGLMDRCEVVLVSSGQGRLRP
jgi:tryptophan 2-monooxygenase